MNQGERTVRLVPPLAASTEGARGSTERGPRVFLDYDQRELDTAYDQSAYAPNSAQIIRRFASNSERARARLGAPRRAAYGPSAMEGLDIYAADAANAPVFIFLHGGAWRGGEAKNYAFAAETFVAAGAHFVVPDFIAVQDAGGDLGVMAAQVRRAVAWVYRHAAEFGGDPERLFVGGHSSGGHLAGLCLTTDWAREHGLPADCIKGGLCSSGLYDLAPVRLSSRNRYVNIDDAAEQALSPLRHLAMLRAPLVVSHGSCESPEFQRQAREFVQAARAAGARVEFLIGESYNHFEMPETLASPYGLLGRAVLRLMRLADD